MTQPHQMLNQIKQLLQDLHLMHMLFTKCI